MKKLSKACYIIRNAKTYMSVSSLKVIYYAFFHLVMSYGIIFWGNSSHTSIIFRIQKKKQLELWKDVGTEFRVETYLRNYKFCLMTSQYMLSLLMFVVQNKNLFLTNNKNHDLDTRQRNNLYLPQANLTIYQKGTYYLGIKMFNNSPLEIKNLAGNQKKI